MAEITVTRGLDIPITGAPSGNVSPIVASGEPLLIALNLSVFDDTKFHLLAKVGDSVKIGQPIAEDKDCKGRFFVSPAAGTIEEVRRGYKRRITNIVIRVGREEDYHTLPPLDIAASTGEAIANRLKEGGLFTRIRKRPLSLLADPDKPPRSIFVSAHESAPFVPPAELQVQGYEKFFQAGLDALAKLTTGAVHLVYAKGSACRAFTDAKQVQHHTVEGPHPAGNHSLHIQTIDPINSADCCIWTLRTHDVIAIGHLLTTGKYLIDRVIGIAGPAVLPDRRGYFKVREGIPVKALITNRLSRSITPRLISGDPLMGHKVDADDFLTSDAYAFTVVPECEEREFLHFFRAGSGKYSFSRAYLSGHLDNTDRRYNFTTSQHGEHRAFVDASLYDKVQPLNISTIILVKAVMAQNYELAEEMGLLEVDKEDFALTAFVCPSKVEMVQIVKDGLKSYATEVLGMPV